MIVVKLQGGLGNQMFQYAAAKALALQRNTHFLLDHSFLEDRTPRPHHVFRDYDLDVFQLQAAKASPRQTRLFFERWPWWKARGVQLGILSPHVLVREPHFHYWEGLQTLKGHLYLDGYWQSPKYFESIGQQLRMDFQFRQPLLENSIALAEGIHASESVCVNVRRGDFLQNDFHTVCSVSYFLTAMQWMKDQLFKPQFFVFADDKEWAFEVFGAMDNVTLVGAEHDGWKYGNKLQLMSSCRHFIIPNSSFAWWAVWLANQQDNLVVAPSEWFADPSWDTSDLIPGHWKRLSPNMSNA